MFNPRDNVHLIKQKANALCYTEVMPTQRARHFVIGFPSVVLARKAQYTLSPQPAIRLYRRDFDDVCPDVNAGLKEFGMHTSAPKIILDTRAKLHLPKNDTNLPSDHPLNDGNYHLAIVPMEDFLMYPFEKNIGIILPYELEFENDQELVFTSNVIESTESTDAFRASLKL